jgi:hypothetical protein
MKTIERGVHRRARLRSVIVGLVLLATGGSAFRLTHAAGAAPASQRVCGEVVEIAGPTSTRAESVRESRQASEPLSFWKTVNALAGIFRKPRNYFDPDAHACSSHLRSAGGTGRGAAAIVLRSGSDVRKTSKPLARAATSA